MDGSFALKTRVPDSVLPYPEGLWNRVKYFFWKAITPGYLFGLNTLLKLHILKHDFRQNWVIGKLAPGKSADDFVQYLHTKGFDNHFIAWRDNGEIVSLRKLKSFEWQYHIRVFNDGEVRGHYEYTPEAHPIRHANETRWEPRQKEFLEFVGDWVISEK